MTRRKNWRPPFDPEELFYRGRRGYNPTHDIAATIDAIEMSIEWHRELLERFKKADEEKKKEEGQKKKESFLAKKFSFGQMLMTALFIGVIINWVVVLKLM
jgi:hypothetical protein